jgi:multidrug resistance efflux pump
VLWAVAIAVAIPLSFTSSGLGVAPAVVEVREVALVSPRDLRLEKVLVAPGQQVAEGQLLAQLEGGQLQAELAVARAELEQLELAVSSREIELRDDRSEEASKLAGEAERAALDVSQLVAEDSQDRSELSQLDEQLARQQKLVAEGLASAANLNDLKLRRAALAQKIEGFRAAISQARQNASATARRLEEWRAAAKGEEHSDGSHIEQRIAPDRAAAEAQRERVRQLEQVMSRIELRAPFAGRVGAVLHLAGAVVPTNGQVITVVDDRPKSAVAYVDQRWASRVRLGDRARLVPSDRSGPPRFGKVVSLGASIAEMPARFWHFPNQPSFGRQVFVELEEAAPLPGQVFDATFSRAAGGGR